MISYLLDLEKVAIAQWPRWSLTICSLLQHHKRKSIAIYFNKIKNMKAMFFR